VVYWNEMSQPKIVAVMSDVMFASRILDAAKRAGCRMVMSKTAESARTQAPDAALLIFDLNCAEVDTLAVIGELKSSPAAAAIPMLAFGRHTDAASLRSAAALGVGDVMPRSRFVEELGAIVSAVSQRVGA
jgi:DNA-binding NarL/FixJ family response regulator